MNKIVVTTDAEILSISDLEIPVNTDTAIKFYNNPKLKKNVM